MGIKVKYSRLEFMDWYEKAHKNYPGNDPTVGRIDHAKDYCFDNIELVSFRENRSERWKRRGKIGNMPKKVGIFSKNTDECIAVFSSINDCSKFVDTDSGNVQRACVSGKKRVSKKYTWYYGFVGKYGEIIRR